MSQIILRFSTDDSDTDAGASRVATDWAGNLSTHLDDTGEWIAGGKLPSFRHIPMARLFARAKPAGSFRAAVAEIADEIRNDTLVIDTWAGPWFAPQETFDRENPPDPIRRGTLVEVSARIRAKPQHINRISGLISGRWTGRLRKADKPLDWPHAPAVRLTQYRERNGIRLWSE